MTQLKIYNLEDTEQADAVSTFYEGEHIIGRGALLNCNDKRISRSHALITVSKASVTIKAVHVNPCFFKAVDGKNVIILPKDKSIELKDGDCFALLADLFWFKVRVLLEGDRNGDSKLLKRKTSHDEEVSNSEEKNSPCKSDVSEFTSENDDKLSASKKFCDETNSVQNFKRQKTSLENEYNISNSTENIVENKNADISSVEQLVNGDYDNEAVKNASRTENFQGIPSECVFLNNVKEEKPNVTEKSALTSEGKDINDVPTDLMNDCLQTGSVKTEDALDLVDNVKIKQEKETSCSTNDENEASCSTNNPNKTKTRRERCWYGTTCYRKNPNHLTDFSHPGDDDYNSDPDDDRPLCPFGVTCYRRNIDHRRQYKHSSAPASKPNDNGKPKKRRSPKKKQKTDDNNSSTQNDNDDDNNDNSDINRKKRKAALKGPKTYAETPEDDYDYDDPFIDDASSDEYQLSDDEDDTTDWEDSQQADEESQETTRLLKEAKRFSNRK